jgi:tetratricopeptide (TPR) repeat protein
MRQWILVGVCLVISVAATASAAPQRTAEETERAAWTAVNEGRIQDAAQAFSEAARLQPRSARVMLGAGLTAFLLGRFDDARQQLSAALQVQPSLTEASVLLGQLTYRQGDVNGAVQIYEQALAHAPGNAMLTARLDAWRREAELHDRFNQRVADHFTVMFEGPNEERVAARAVEILEAAYWRLGTTTGLFPDRPITVVLYTQQQFQDVTRSPAWSGGAFDGRIRVPIRGALGNQQEFERVLGHEFTHALVYMLAPRAAPQWLNEGLAVLFEPSTGPGNGAAARSTLVSRAQSAEEDGTERALLPLARLERSFEGLSNLQARLAYAQSAVAAQAAIDLIGLPAVFEVLSQVGHGVTFADAFDRASPISYAEFQRSYLAPR